MATPTKLHNRIVLGLGVLASTQWSHPRRFCHWYPSFGDNGYLHLRALHKTNYFYCIAILISCQPRKIFITTWYQWQLVYVEFRSKKLPKTMVFFLKIEIRKQCKKTKSASFFMLSYRILMARPFFKMFRFEIFSKSCKTLKSKRFEE